jgi:hypothetical protein
MMLAPFVGYCMYKAACLVADGWKRRAVYVGYSVAFLLLLIVRSPMPLIASSNGSLQDRLAVVQEAFGVNRWNTREEKLDVISYIQRNTDPADEIEFCSMDNEITWRAKRSQPSRFTLIHPLGMDVNGQFTPYQRAWQQEIVDIVKSARPKLVMLNSKPEHFLTFLSRTPEEILHSIPGFDAALMQHYEQDTVIGTWTIYRRTKKSR